MKTKNLFLFSLLVTLFAGCSKESVMQPQTEPEEISAQTESEEFNPQHTAQPIGALYVNNFDTTAENFTKILGNAIQEDSFLNWCKAQGFTEMNLYGIGRILRGDSAKKAQLNAFVGKAHSVMYGLKVNFAVVDSNGVKNIGTYCANYSNKPDGIITEYEFWKAPYSWATFKTILKAMTVVHNTYPSIKRNAYVNHFKDANGVTSDGYITKYILENCETIFLVNYYTDAYNLTGDLRTKLKVLGDRAKQNNKVGNVIILFKVHQSPHNIYSYFSVQVSNHEFIDAYNNLMDDYNDPNDPNYINPNNDGLSFKGYAIFHHTDARQARP